MSGLAATVPILIVVLYLVAASSFVIPPYNKRWSSTGAAQRAVKKHHCAAAASPSENEVLEALVSKCDDDNTELNDKCLQDLKNYPFPIAKRALEEYQKQQTKRSDCGKRKIEYPSLYILAIARNLLDQEEEEEEEGNSNTDRSNRNGRSGGSGGTSKGAAKSQSKAYTDKSIPKDGRVTPRTRRRRDERLKTQERDGQETRTEDRPIHTEASRDDSSTTLSKDKVVTTKRISDRIRLSGPQQPPSWNGSKTKLTQESPALKAEPTPSSKVDIETAKKCVSNLVKLEQPISTLTGVGPKTAEALARLNLHTVRSLLWHFPASFIDRTKICTDIISKARCGDIVTLRVRVESMYNAGKVFKVKCRDASNNILEVVYFCGSSRRAAAGYRQLFQRVGSERIVSGKLQETFDKKSTTTRQMIQPDWVKPISKAKSVQRIEPVYRLTQGLTQTRMAKAVDQALELGKETLECIPEVLSSATLESLNWPTLARALVLAHRPESETDFKGGPKSPPRMRLAFEELCMQQAHLALARWRYKAPLFFQGRPNLHNPGGKKETLYMSSWTDSPLVSLAVSLLPFSLTNAQKRCLEEAWDDSVSNHKKGRMARLLQGDVSSGKTVVAYLLALGCLEAGGGGGVAAILAPTTILANQHTRSLSQFIETLNQQLSKTPRNHQLQNIHVELLTGGVTGARREEVLGRMENCSPNEAYVLVGTHALLTESVASRLGNLTVGGEKAGLSLAVVDEEQRFGVAQRGVLSRCAAHTLYMTATPIPRTLALGGYSNNMAPQFVRTGSMDVSILDSKPKGVKPVKTSLVKMEKVDQVIHGVIEHLAAGAKVFWILPRIGNNDTVLSEIDKESDLHSESEAMSVLERYNYLSRILGPNRVGMVHGRMTSLERETQLTAFADASLGVDVMVGTTVLEVGIDIASVTILVVEGAERFGLSQLHQLRGRIGRAVKKNDNLVEATADAAGPECHCVLLTRETSTDSLNRLNVLRETNDGSCVAMADFDLRGPGEMVGLQQAGLKNGYTVDLSHHYDLVHPAAILGRLFAEGDMAKIVSDMAEGGVNGEKSNLLRLLVANSKVENQAAADSAGGFRIRAGLAFFGDWKLSLEENNVASALSSLRMFSSVKATESDNKKNEFEGMFVTLSQKLGHGDKLVESFDSMEPLQVSLSENEAVTSGVRVNGESADTATEEETPSESKPIFTNRSPTEEAKLSSTFDDKSLPGIMQEEHYETYPLSVNRNNVKKDSDTIYLVVDTETTGLSSSSYIIQVAAKVLGSDNPKERFSAYCCPPVHLDRMIEELTGITDTFLHSGGLNPATGEIVNGRAPPFAQVYRDFCDFCNQIRGSKEICVLAHNAPFDVRMLNAEVKRLAAAARIEGRTGTDIPLLSRDTGIVAYIDTLQLLRSRDLWQQGTPRPTSFNLESVYGHIFHSPMALAHNAYGDVLGLERIILSDELQSWETIGKKVKTRLSIPANVTSNLLHR